MTLYREDSVSYTHLDVYKRQGKELAYLVQDIDKPVIQLTSFVNKQEIKDKLREYCEANRIK